MTATHGSHYCTCLGHLGWHDRDRIISILCWDTQGGQVKYSSGCRVSLLQLVLLTNFTNVNGPIGSSLLVSCHPKASSVVTVICRWRYCVKNGFKTHLHLQSILTKTSAILCFNEAPPLTIWQHLTRV